MTSAPAPARAPDGRVALWPTHVFAFQRLMARFDAASYSLRSTPAARDGSPVRQGRPPERHLAAVPDRA